LLKAAGLICVTMIKVLFIYYYYYFQNIYLETLANFPTKYVVVFFNLQLVLKTTEFVKKTMMMNCGTLAT
jgi:hypothetical protein